MKITRNDSERLVIVDFPYFLGVIFSLVVVALISHGVNLVLEQSHKRYDIFWSFAGGLLFILVTGVFVNRCVFDFDLRLRQLRWSRTGLYGRKSGTVSLGNITGCVVQTTIGDKGAMESRVALEMTDGELPLTVNYMTGTGCESVRSAIDQALGLAPKLPREMDDASLRDMIRRGAKIEAIRFVREKRNCSIAAAKQIVEDLQKKVVPDKV